MTLPEGNRLNAAKEKEKERQAHTAALRRPITLLAQHMEAPLRMAVVAQPQRPTIERAALTPISTDMATPIATVVATPISTAVAIAMTQPRTPAVLVATIQRLGQRLTQPPHKVLAAPTRFNASQNNIVRQVTRSPHGTSGALTIHQDIFDKHGNKWSHRLSLSTIAA